MSNPDNAPRPDRSARSYELEAAAHARAALAGLATPMASELLARSPVVDLLRAGPTIRDVTPAPATQRVGAAIATR